MNEKIEKIKKQFEDQTSSVENIKRLLEDNMVKIRDEIEELSEIGAIDKPELLENSNKLNQQRQKEQEAVEKKLSGLTQK